MSATQIAVVLAAVALGFFAKGVTGIGGPLLAIPVLAAFEGVEYAVAVIAIPTLVANVWLLWRHRSSTSTVRRYLRPLLIAGVIAIPFGVWILVSVSDRAITLVLALVIIGYIIWFLANPQLKLSVRTAQRVAAPTGFVAGAMQGATGISGPILVTFFHSLGLKRSSFIAAVTIPFLILGAAQITSLVVLGAYDSERVAAAAIAVIPAVAVLTPAARLGERIQHQTFQYVVLALLAATAIRLLWSVFT